MIERKVISMLGIQNSLKVAIILMLAFLSISVWGQSSQESFQSSNLAYENKKYDEAITGYNSILDNGELSPELFLNLGNAYFQKQDFVSSILSFERGLKLAPNHKGLQKNLDFANDKIDSDILVVPPFILVQFWRGFTNIFSTSIWAILQVLMFVLITAAIVFLFTKTETTTRRKAILSLFVSVPLFLIISLAVMTRSNMLNSSDSAIIMEDTVLTVGPDLRSDTLTNVSAGLKLSLQDDIGEWSKVKLSNQLIGWIEKSKMEKI